MYKNIYKGKRVLVTGNTGFKGAWLSVYLLRLGAEVIGYAQEPPTTPSLYEQADLAQHITHYAADIRDTARLLDVMQTHRPHFVFHLAAQPLVLASYRQPVETFDVNVMGSISVMEAVRQSGIETTLIMVATDKVYENYEWEYGYREHDPLGGYDPYSASKAAMEIAVSAYARSFFSDVNVPVRMASVRSGNVIGGGDWAQNRIVPDCIRALQSDSAIAVRSPHATRPWQHVLEPISGYLWLAAQLSQSKDFAGAWNFGPTLSANCTVQTLVEQVLAVWGSGTWQDQSDPTAPHEANLLKLSIDKASALLGWQPVWGFAETITRTIGWYKAAQSSADGYALCLQDIDHYEVGARALGLPYAD